MNPQEHDEVLAITSHLPHLSAFSIFHTARNQEEETGNPVAQFSAGTFRDFTRVAVSNPQMWRDIFLLNKEPLKKAFQRFVDDMQEVLEAVENNDPEKIETLISASRKMRTEIIDDFDYTQKKKSKSKSGNTDIIRPYSSD